MGLHFERNPDHAANPRPKDECYPCYVESIDFALPAHFKAVRQGSRDGISEYSAFKTEMAETLRNDREGRFEKVR